MKAEATNPVGGVGRLLSEYARLTRERLAQKDNAQPQDAPFRLTDADVEQLAAALGGSVEAPQSPDMEEDAASIELSRGMEELDEMHRELERFKEDLKNAEEQAEAAGEEMENVGKILAIFRRISKGDIVPARDEQKLMEYDSKLYNAAKQLGMMAKNDDPKRHKSVDSDEEHRADMQKKIDAMMAPVPEIPQAAAQEQTD